MENLYQYNIQIGLTAAVVLSFFIMRWLIQRSVRAFAKLQNQEVKRLSYVLKIINLTLTLIALLFLAFVWKISLEGLSVYFASIFTIIGVAFFASWSLLSNVTAAMILFFYYPFKIGSKVKILDGDNGVTGVITNISLFTMMIRSDDNRDIVIPNNVVMQKTSILLDEDDQS